MMRIPLLFLLAGSTLTLSGCVAGMAASAIGMAANSVRGERISNRHLQPAAREACAAIASAYGAVHIIDVEQRAADRIVVWGTVGQGEDRRSFECAYGTNITGFKVRKITPIG